MINKRKGCATAVVCRIAVFAVFLSSCTITTPRQVGSPKALSSRTVFFVGGTYIGPKGRGVMDGQMYVEVLDPPVRSHPYPLVMFHGAAQTAVNWLTTPDGRPGWVDVFLKKGYQVVLVDQPWRGRSAWHPQSGHELRNFTAPTIERLFTATRDFADWPQSRMQMQWPGTGRIGDSVFDQFEASQVEFVRSNEDTERAVQQAGISLLERIGPAILVTHSQAGTFGWLIADARPNLVKAIVAIEPQGPPMQDAVLGTGRARPWGITDIPITYDSERRDQSPLVVEQEELSEGAGLVRCWKQRGHVRTLSNLVGIPILIEVSESSYHAAYDHCTANWLTQAGVRNLFVRLPDVGIRGNGHMQMLEKNSDQIAEWLEKWIAKIE